MLLRAGIIVAFFTLLSRLLGLVRELITASLFGSTAIGDCINVAFRFPNLFRRIFGEGALSSVFIPIFNKKLAHSPQHAREFSSRVFSLLLLILVILSILLYILMPSLMVIIAPGFYLQEGKYELTILLCRITTPYLIFISITALFGGILNSLGRFAAFAFAPVIMNIWMILLLVLSKKQQIIAIHYITAIALLSAGMLQVIFMYYCLGRADFKISLIFSFKDSDVKKLLNNMAPAVLTSGVQQLNLFISQSIASFIPGAISILTYSDRLYQLPLSLIGTTFGTILLPKLSQIYKDRNFNQANILQNQAIAAAFFITIPSTIGLIILARPIIAIIFQHGAFTIADTVKTANALAVFTLGLPAYVLTKIFTPIFYANCDPKTPLKITIYSIIANIILNILLMIKFSYLGIALGSSIAAWFNVLLLRNGLKSYGNFTLNSTTRIIFIKVLISSFIMTIFVFLAYYRYSYLLYSPSLFIKTLTLFIIIITAIAVFIIFSYLQKTPLSWWKNYETGN